MKRFKINYVYKHDRLQVHPATIEGEDRQSAVRHFVQLNIEYGVEVITARELHKSIYTFEFQPPVKLWAMVSPTLDDLLTTMNQTRQTFHAEGWDREDAWINANAQFRVWLWENGYR